MATPGLPVSRLVSVSVNLEPPAPQVENVDTCVIMGISTVIDVTQRMRLYESITAIATDFGTSAAEYLAAVLWFEQNPAPMSLYIARWAKTASAGQLVGGPLPTLVYTDLTAITSGSFFVIINGIPLSITGLNFSSITNLNGAATLIQTAVAALSASCTCVWNATYTTFTITSGTTGITSTVGFGAAPTATGKATFSGQPSAADTLTLNGTVITFRASGASGNEVNIGASLTITLASLLSFLNASSDTQLVKFHYVVSGSVLYFYAVTSGTGGNSLTLAKSAAAITLSAGTLSGGAGTDVSATFGLLSASSGSYVADGVASETALEAVVILDNKFSNLWYGLTIIDAANSDHLAVAAYVEASSVTKHFYGVTSQEGAIITSTDTTSIAYQLKALLYKHTAVQYSSTNAYAAVSLLARILTTNWQANNTTITLMYKQEPGIVAENLSSTQANNIQNDNCNVFVNYNNSTAIIQYGVCCSGDYIDTIIGLDWLAITLQAAWYATLYNSPTKIPQTDAGMHILATVAEQTMGLGVNNGLLAPGVWNSNGFGALITGDFLEKGYYVYQPSVNAQPQAQRVLRVSVPFQIAVKLAGAVHTVDGSILVNS